MAVLATSCEKDPDLSKLDNNFTVYTNYDSKTNFNDFKTYCLPDSILLIGQGMKAEYWNCLLYTSYHFCPPSKMAVILSIP